MRSTVDTRMLNAIAALLRRHSLKYGAAEVAGETIVISTDDGMVILSARRPAPSIQVLVEVDEEELSSLKDDARRLRALEEAGVGNWSGYEYAMSIYRDGES